MRLSKADLTAVFLTGTMAFASTTLYFVDQPKSRSRGNEKPVGTLIQKVRVAERKSGDEVIWEEVNNKSPVYNGDSIRTAKNSLAQLKLDDGTDLDLEQDSLIVLSMDEDGMNVNFAHGSLSAKRSETSGAGGTEGSKLKIKSGDKVVKIDKSDVSIAGGENKKFTAMVTKGTAEITAGKEKIVVKQDEKATIAEKVEVKVVPLRLRSPDPGLRRVTRNEKEKLRFEWQGNEGDNETLEISDRPDFSSVAVRRSAPGRVLEENLTEGNWYWRVRGKSETSDVRTISIRRDQPISLLEPSSGASFTYSEVPPLIPLAWSENALVSEYQIVVSRDEAGKDIVKNQTSGKNRISLTGLPEGDYFWRVIYQVDLSSGAEETRTAPFKFSIRKEEMIAPAALTSPENKTSIRRDQLTNRGLSLLWSGGNERRTDFQVIVARDADLKNPVLRKELSLPYFQVNAALDEGTYFWAVERKDRKGMPLLSEVRTFQVLPAPVPKPATVVKTETPSTPTNTAVSKTDLSKASNQNESGRNGVAVTGSVLESGTGFSDETSEPEKIVPKVKPRIAMSEVQKPSSSGAAPIIVEKKIEEKVERKIEPRPPEKKPDPVPTVVAEEKTLPKTHVAPEKKPDQVTAVRSEDTKQVTSNAVPEKKPEIPRGEGVPAQPALLRLRVEPEEAIASLAGTGEARKRIGKQSEVVPGKYSLLVSMPGYIPSVQQIVLRSGETMEVALALVKDPGKGTDTNFPAFPTLPVLKSEDIKESVSLLDGRKLEGRILRRDGMSLVLQTDHGEETIPKDEVAEINYVSAAVRFPTEPLEPRVAPDKLTFIDDRVVYGRILEKKNDVLRVMTVGGLREYRQDQIQSIENRSVEPRLLTNGEKPIVFSSNALLSRLKLLDGSELEGEIISERSGKIRIRTAQGLRTIAREEVDRGAELGEAPVAVKKSETKEPDLASAPDRITLLDEKVIFGKILGVRDGKVRIQTGTRVREISQGQVAAMESRVGNMAKEGVLILTNSTRLIGGKPGADKKDEPASRWMLLDGSVVEGELLSEQNGKLRVRTSEGIRMIVRAEIERVLSGRDSATSPDGEKGRVETRQRVIDERYSEIILLDDTVIQARVLSQTEEFLEIMTGRGKRKIPLAEIKKIVYSQK